MLRTAAVGGRGAYHLVVGSLGKTLVRCGVSGFCCEVDENCTLLGHYAVTSGNFLYRLFGTTYRSLLRRSGRWDRGCPKTLARNYRYSLRNNHEERSSKFGLIAAWEFTPEGCGCIDRWQLWWCDSTSAEGHGDGGVGRFLQLGKIVAILSQISGKYWLAHMCVCGIKPFLPDNFIPYGVNVEKTAKLVILKVGS